MSNTPGIDLEKSGARITFSDEKPWRSSDFVCMLDMTGGSDLVAVEILDVQQQIGPIAQMGPAIDGAPAWVLDSGSLHLSYDTEVDAMYLRLGTGKAGLQRPGRGTAYLDAGNQLVKLEVQW
jgi:hypothetical protein